MRAAAEETAGRYAAAGIGAGDRVAILARNRPSWVIHMEALERLGASLVPLHPRLTETEITRQAEAASPRLIVRDEDLPAVAAGALVLTWSEIERMRPARWTPAAPDEVREAMVVFTSGTSGVPKGIILTHGNIDASAHAAVEGIGLGPDDGWLLCMPLCHVGGLMIVHRCRSAGATIVLEPGFDADRVNAFLDAGTVSVASLVATTARRTLDARGGRPLPPSLRALIVGGGPVPNDLREADPRVLATYGMTETCSMVTLVRPEASDAERMSAGSLLPGVAMRVNEDQEIEVRGPMVAPRSLAGRRLVDGEGWLRTGDAGKFGDGGFLHVHGRRDEVIITGGENVHPAEIESALLSHPGIAEAVVVGAPDPEWGERPVAFVVPRDPGLDERAILTHLEGRLARFKIPRLMIFSQLPSLSSGKPDRARLRARDATPGSP